MTILSIDTSCDETCIAILKVRSSKFEVRSNIISSQIKILQKYGGVFPSLAKREHQRNLVPVLKKALEEPNFLNLKLKIKNSKSQLKIKRFKEILKEILKRENTLYLKLKSFLEKYKKPKIDAIAVTIGPGLEPCLWVGVNFAKALSFAWNLSIIPVNHIEAHIAANFIGGNPKSQVSNPKQIPSPNDQNEFPAVCLVVSGGHTQLILMEKIGKYKIIGETRDDAAGECFDKTARILGLSYPGGPIIAAKAAKFSIFNSQFSIKLPRPMINTKDYDFSFSGLKTAVLYDFKKRTKKVRDSKGYISEMAREIQQATIDVLIKKTIKAAKQYNVKSIVLGGGVTANNELRKQFKLKIKNLKLKINFLAPSKNLCTDNAAMIAIAGYFSRKKAIKNFQKINVNANLRL